MVRHGRLSDFVLERLICIDYLTAIHAQYICTKYPLATFYYSVYTLNQCFKKQL